MKTLLNYARETILGKLQLCATLGDPMIWWKQLSIPINDIELPDQCEECWQLYPKLSTKDAIGIDPDDTSQYYHMLHTDVRICDECIDNAIEMGKQNIAYRGWIILNWKECKYSTQSACRTHIHNFFKRDKPFLEKDARIDDTSFWVDVISADEFDSGRDWARLKNQHYL